MRDKEQQHTQDLSEHKLNGILPVARGYGI